MIGKRLRDLREEMGLKQSEVAEYLNIVRTTYTQYETDKGKPSLMMINKLSDLYNVSTDYILTKTDIRSNVSMSDIEYALYGEIKHLTEKDQQEILEFARYIKHQKGKD